MQKKSDALSTAWETLSAPVVAADAAMKDKAKQKEKEHKSLQLAVQRNVRERQARQIAKGMPVKVSSVNKNAMSRIGGQPEGLLSRLKTLEKRAIHRHISHLTDDLLKSGHFKSKTPVQQLGKVAAEKQAFIAWGGGEFGLHPEDKGVGGSVGYTNLLGLLPIPTASIDVGDKKRGVQVGAAPVFKYGPSLSNAPDKSSLAPYLGLRWNHPRKSGLSRQFPRGLPEIIYDKLKGRTRDDAVRLSYPEEYAEAPEKEEKEEGDDIQALLAGLSEDGDGDGKINDGTEDEVEVTERADV